MLLRQRFQGKGRRNSDNVKNKPPADTILSFVLRLQRDHGMGCTARAPWRAWVREEGPDLQVGVKELERSSEMRPSWNLETLQMLFIARVTGKM